MEKNLAQRNTTRHQLTLAESRDYVTPYAFEIPESLYGVALATPWKRGVAMAVDLLLVALLTFVHSIFLAAIASWVLVRSSSRLRSKGRFPILRKLLALFAALLLFIVIFASLEVIREASMGESSVSNMAQKAQRLGDVGRFTAHMVQMGMTSENIRAGECAPALQCWQSIAIKVLDDFGRFPLPEAKQREILDAMYEEAQGTLNADELQTFRNEVDERFAGVLSQIKSERTEAAKQSEERLSAEDDVAIVSPLTSSEPAPPSIMDWVRGIIRDLGLGFGWAALYFTVFTAWFKGQTPGKKLLGIKVIRLDGRAPNLWESFGRYGGYGAGFATGLLGFVQLFWDSNRQAIQDKISETLVLDVRKAAAKVENISNANNDKTVKMTIKETQ
ncbi:RDD family protein [Lacimicrobium sp. SS2-24]|uniref:RDD family protein n=1 Tax=Lacimicrobium sp. SS2-24 TaxID=2005569 RepID=UPI001FEE1A13|nr:RDD family protein [Lacimicrobium sp. SS2-24]